jgi:5'-3' exonuclease
MIDLEADDALASAAHIAARDSRVDKVCIWTPDKDLAQCVDGDRVVQMDRRGNRMLDAVAVQAKFGVPPARIPDFLALVGDSADGYPGIDGIGPVTAAHLLNRYGSIESLPESVLGKKRELALLFKRLATLTRDAPLYRDVDALRYPGPTPAFAEWAKRMDAPRLLERAQAARGAPSPTRKRSRAGGKPAA